MSNWVRSAGHYLLIGILFVSLGGHLGLLQTVAWGNMLMNFSRDASLREAAKKTFDGEHPCPLCKMVKETKKQEEKKPLLKAEAKLDIALPVPVRVPVPWSTEIAFRVTGFSGTFTEVYAAVPMQPPRAV